MFLQARFINAIIDCHKSVKTAQQAFIKAYWNLEISLIVIPNVDYLLGEGWQRLFTLACRPLPWWELAKLANKLQRRLIKGAAWCKLHSHALVWNLAYREGKELPRWPTNDRLVGLFVDEEDAEALELGEDLTALGLPVWAITEVDKLDNSA